MWCVAGRRSRDLGEALGGGNVVQHFDGGGAERLWGSEDRDGRCVGERLMGLDGGGLRDLQGAWTKASVVVHQIDDIR